MKLMVVNTPHGLVPMYDDDYDEKKKLKLGATYSAEIHPERNAKLHGKYFSLFGYAWEFLTEQECAQFITRDGFRKSVEIAAGHFEVYYDLQSQSYRHGPKSVSFGSMDNAEFSDLYDRVKDVIFALIGDRLNEDELVRLLAY